MGSTYLGNTAVQKLCQNPQPAKNFPKNSRRRENPLASSRSNNNKTQPPQTAAKVRPNVDKRPRARGFNGNINHEFVSPPPSSSRLVAEESLAAPSSDEGANGLESNRKYDVNSVYSAGCRKQNLNHLLNFYYTPREVDYYDGAVGASGSYGQRHGQIKKHKYNKEQFIQANFQFVIKASAKRKANDSPDSLIDWSLIEQINIQTSDEPQCPICLYPPVAAKVTRCGHVYCWTCVLHYLSLSDKTWRKCPICYDAVHVGDLKSASIVQQSSYNIGSQITFRLMRRKKGSLLIEKYENWQDEKSSEFYPYVSSPMEDKLFSKFVLARRADIFNILERERSELLSNVDESCPEFVFVQQAIELLTERSEKLGEIKDDENVVQSSELQIQHCDTDIVCDDSVLNNGECATESNGKANQSSGRYYYFYQAADGQNVYLHPLNVKMLQANYGSLSEGPPLIEGRILQKEQHSMDEDHRRKFTCLGHLPLTCEFSVVEIELLPPYVTEDVIKSFKADIVHRKKERQRKAREEREREKQINAINDRQMGKLISSAAAINIMSADEFPICGFEEPLSPIADPTDDIPSTSKGSRKKTISTSSVGSSSYSSIALHCQQEIGPWKTAKPVSNVSKNIVMSQTSDNEEGSILNSFHTNLGDVLAQALSKKKSSDKNMVNVDNSGNKKSKKGKKMVPLFTTGMNFSN
ncbi:E3 ubiquitin-protein ligase RNF10 [Musca vetustissima]|uniref:E3 ubiquitin-protein ligase RNF10 n=1 Tax=Musca vetustissima TaxID=27455 RepID=UPI002AB6AAE2|nr:E3 ubiquitin-protein ligase RNF10 [Musca vetustissima]